MKSEIEQFGTPSSTNRTLEATIAEYVEGARRPSEQTAGTRNKDKMFTEAITAYLGWRKTADLRVQDVESFLEDFADGNANASGKPVSKDYVRRARSFIAAALRNDMRLGHIHLNVAEIANLPSTEVTSKERRALTVEEWRALHNVASGTTKLVVDLAGRHGLRPQELRALGWSAVRLDAGTLSVVTQFDSHDQFVDPKTTGSTRTIHMHPELVDALSTWQARQPRHATGPGSRSSRHTSYATPPSPTKSKPATPSP
jgi:integrase